MGNIKRTVGEPLRLRLSLGDNNQAKFVRAQLFVDGVSLALVTCPHQADGIYGNNIYAMPNVVLIDAKYKVYFDSLFAIEDPTYFSATDQYEIDDGASNQAATVFPQSVYANVADGWAEIRVEEFAAIQTIIETQIEIDALVEPPLELAVDLSKQNEITGVINEQL